MGNHLVNASRIVVAWWYSPITERWVRWSAKNASDAGEALLLAMQQLEWMPPGARYVDVWRREGKTLKHETRYRGDE